MDVLTAGFDWDEGNLEKCRRHSVGIASIEAMFGKLLWMVPDPVHSDGEQRFRAIGIDESGRHIFIAFTLRGRPDAVLIRPISARCIHKKKIRHYEKQKAEAEKTSRPEKR
jgi:hypothetical protein